MSFAKNVLRTHCILDGECGKTVLVCKFVCSADYARKIIFFIPVGINQSGPTASAGAGSVGGGGGPAR